MNSIYCEICQKKVDVPGFININDAKAVHLHAHTAEWVQEAIKYIKEKNDDDARCLIQKLEKIQKDFITIIEDLCIDKVDKKECVQC